MKFSCSTSDFLRALNIVSRAIGGQQALPILGNVLLEARGNTCTVSATDLELSIITSFEAKIETEGSITIPSKTILNFAQYNNDPEVMIELKEGSHLHCVSRSAKTSIAGESANDYPTIAAIEKQNSFTLPVSSLLNALHLVTFASARTSLRPVLSGVYVRSIENELILVATDSYRLSEYRIPIEGMKEGTTCIIPTKILEEVKVLLSSKKGDKSEKEKEEKSDIAAIPSIEIILSRQQIEFQIGQTRLLSRLIEGKFPDYTQIIPKEATTHVSFTVKDLLIAVRRMHYFAKEVNNKLTFDCKREQTLISTPETQVGRDEATLMAELTGNEGKIALSSSYLLDFLGHIDAEAITMQMTDSQHPAVFLLPQEDKYLHLVMPLRMGEA